MTLRAVPFFGHKAIGKQGYLHDTRWDGIALFTLMKAIIIIALIALVGCARNQQNLRCINAPEPGHGPCPFCTQ
jgi:hypothetical protein